MTLPIEEALEGKYEILEKIGEGGIGSVYKVRHRLLDEIRVIKVLRPQMAAKGEHQDRFLHEARMAVRLKHPNIAQMHDFSVAEDRTAFIVMEFIDGVALNVLLKAPNPPSLDLTLEIAQQSLRALSYLHAHDLVHRDISPDNLMVTASFEGTAQIKLIDLGIVKNLAEDSNLTQTGMFLGKVRYCSPEQFSSGEETARPLDHRSDLYSFGVLLYELLTGAYPFAGDTFAELAGCHLFQPPVSFDETDPEGRVPEGLRAVVLEALAKDPDARPASADEFIARLQPFTAGGASIEAELSRTVETVTSAGAFKNYTRPGSTQDRLNSQFGMKKTEAPRPLTAVDQSETLIWHGDGPAAPPKPASETRKWLLIAGVAAAAVVVAIGLWLAIAGTGGEPVASLPQADSRAIQVEQTERFSMPERDASSLVPLDLAPPPTEEKPVVVAPQPVAARPEPREEPAVASEPETPAADPALEGAAEESPTAADLPPATTTEIYQPGVGVVPPVLEILAAPAYPEGKRPKNEIVVDVSVLVDEHGKVLTAVVTRGAQFKRRFREAAVETAKSSAFRPAMKDGVAGRMKTDMRIVFEPE